MREGWKQVNITEITSLITKGTTPSTYGFDFIPNGEINFIRAEGISKDGYIDDSTFLKINSECHEKLKRSKISENDILFSIAGMALGKSGLVKKRHLPANTNQAVAILRPNNLVHPSYLFYYIVNPSFYKIVNSVSGQAAQPNINLKQVGGLPVLLPPLPTQRLIASMLSAYDDLIENNLKRIKLLEEKAQLTYEEWFVRMKFPGYENVKVDEETGLPEGWRSGTLADLVDYQSGFAFKSSKFKEDGFPVIKIKNIANNTIDTSNTVFIDEEYAKQASKFKLKPGDLLIAMTGATIGKVGIMPVTEKSCFLNQRVGRFLRKNVLDNTAFVNCLFTIGQGLNHVMNIAGGAAQPNISASQILSIETIIPDEEILIIFSELTTNSNNTILKLLNQNQLLKEARDILLPRLMSGMVDVEELTGMDEYNLSQKEQVLLAAEGVTKYKSK